MSFRKGNKLNRAALKEWLRPPESAAMTGAQIARMVLGIVAVIAIVLMVCWVVSSMH